MAKRGAAPTSPRIERALRWRLLELLNIYRLLLAAAIFLVGVVPAFARALALDAPRLTMLAGLVYLLFALGLIAALGRRRPRLSLQNALEPLTDLFAAIVIVQATGANLGILAVLLAPPVAVAGAGADSRRRALFFASLATLLLLAVVGGRQIGRSLHVLYYTEAALFGIAAFVLALLSHTFARALGASMTLAEHRGQRLRRADEINRLIVSQLRIGVVVLDAAGKPALVNPAARRLLGEPGLATLAEHGEALAAGSTLREIGGATLRTSSVALAAGEDGGAPARLVFVEEADAAARQAQALKLAALGRLGAAIAHQIRNPLGAIAHAAQLLGEAAAPNARETRLIAIIRRQSARLDRLVGDILGFSRPGSGGSRSLRLRAWLEEYLASERERDPARAARLHVTRPEAGLVVHFDPVHLEHIVANLLDNALRHGDSPAGIELACIEAQGRAAIEVRDRGAGLTADVEALFEPFATTHAAGTGLGLYIARELADANGARLSAAARAGGGACFRLDFAESPQWLE
ncbi:MAG TPA: ATP-binding protein [Gammaproteobacteria bacterium]|nr:ATP-binding protein [Gammaproteobacteria bacterium]